MSDNLRGSASTNDPSSNGEQDWLLPIANVGRIMKQILPPNAKIAKEGKETMQECVSEFISFVTGEASEKCKKERRKIVNGDDICWAMGRLGFDNYEEPLKRYLHRYRELEEGDHHRGGVNQVKVVGINEEMDQDYYYLLPSYRINAQERINYQGEASNPDEFSSEKH